MSDLDDVLGHVHDDVPPMSEESFQAGRQRLIAAMAAGSVSEKDNAKVVPLHRFRRRTAFLAAAAAVAAVVTGIAVIPGGSPQSSLPTVSAAPMLSKAADVTIGSAPDPVVGPGQYLLVQEHAWWFGPSIYPQPDYGFLAENRVDTWVPADQSKLWRMRRTINPDPKVIFGDESKARQDIAMQRKWLENTQQADGGDFYDTTGTPAQPDLERPTPKYLASLPTDPKQLYETLVRAEGNDETLVEQVAYGLSSGLYPAEFRARLYKALTYVKGLEVVDQVANLDGRKGVALGLRTGAVEWQLIIDPTTGRFIGSRQMVMQDWDGLSAGTVLSYDSVTSKVVNAMGATS